MAIYTVAKGIHHVSDPIDPETGKRGPGTTYRKGDQVKSDQPLDKLFVNKFVEGGGPTAPVGKDVSEDFPNDGGLRVFKNGRRYHVYDEADNQLTTEPVTKAVAMGFIEEELAEDE